MKNHGYIRRAELEVVTVDFERLHPDHDYFGVKFYRQYHITQNFRLAKRFYFVAQMQFARSHTWMIEPAFRGEQHQFASVGVNGGFEWAIFPPKPKR